MSSLVWGVGSTRNSRSLLKNSVLLGPQPDSLSRHVRANPLSTPTRPRSDTSQDFFDLPEDWSGKTSVILEFWTVKSRHARANSLSTSTSIEVRQQIGKCDRENFGGNVSCNKSSKGLEF